MSNVVSAARELIRTAPDGTQVTVALPTEIGAVEWFGTTRFSGSGFVRGVTVSPAGRHRVIPSKIMPGARRETFQRRGFDILLFEAKDRTDSCLVWAGPHHEATTWFGGPAPRREVLNRLVSTLTFTDSAPGARILAEPAAGLQQHTTMLIAQNDQVLLMMREAGANAHTLPDWSGMVHGDGEIWRERRALEGAERDALAGTPFEWRYVIANSSAIVEVIFTTPPGFRVLDSSSAEAMVTSVLSGLRASWN